MFRSFFLFILLTALLVAGCSPSLTPEPINTSLPTPKANAIDWPIKMIQSGGIMGLLRSIKISSDGKYTITDERANKTVTGELKANELSKLNQIISETRFASSSGPKSSVCADCFIYTFETQGGGKQTSYQADDITLPTSGLEPLVTYLREKMDNELK